MLSFMATRVFSLRLVAVGLICHRSSCCWWCCRRCLSYLAHSPRGFRREHIEAPRERRPRKADVKLDLQLGVRRAACGRPRPRKTQGISNGMKRGNERILLWKTPHTIYDIYCSYWPPVVGFCRRIYLVPSARRSIHSNPLFNRTPLATPYQSL